MKNKIVPKFHGLRIYLTSSILYLFLVLPFVTFLVLQNVPERFITNSPDGAIAWDWGDQSNIEKVDSTIQVKVDSIVNEETEIIGKGDEVLKDIDSLVAQIEADVTQQVKEEMPETRGKFLGRFLGVYFKMLLLSFLLGLFFNLPFKRYLNRKRKKQEISNKLESFCKKYLLHSATINLAILSLPHIASHIMAIIYLYNGIVDPYAIESNMFKDFFFVSLVAALLTILFVYFWQKNRVHLRYIEFFFTREELQKRIFKSKRGRIGITLWLSSIITTSFPLIIVVLYFVLSLTSVEDLKIEKLSTDHKEVLLGKWIAMVDKVGANVEEAEFTNFYYVTAIDNIVMFVGMGTGIFVSLFYLLLVLRWNTRSIVNPVNELLSNMKKIRSDGTTDYTIVRTNDEVGELAEGFNVMIGKIRNYISSISQMNVELEQKVVERTKEVVDQKEEIESQKEEIETQLDMVTKQRDTIEDQKYQILDSIHYARRIQNAMLPPQNVLEETLGEHFIFYYPRDIVSGDFYWSTVKKDKVYMVVADCTGHGVPGAFLSILGVSYLNEIVNKDEDLKAAEILSLLRTSLISSLHQRGEEGETKDGMEVALCIVDKKNNKLQFAGARRPLYLVRNRANGDIPFDAEDNKSVLYKKGEFQLLQYKPDYMPIGIYDGDENEFTNREIDYKTGDSIYLFTDGYVDQLGGPDRKTFRVRSFRDLLLDIQGKDMELQRKALEKRIVEWKGKVEQIDDVLVFGLKL